MAEWFPDAVFVVVRRDPRDTVCSILEMWCRMGLVVAAPSRAVGWHVDPAKLRQVCSSVRSATQREDDFLAGLGKARFFRLRYERLVTEPEAVLRPLVVEFLGLQSAEPALQAMRAVAAKDVHGAVGGRVDFVARSVGRWRRDLTADQQDLVDGELRELVVAGDVAPGS